MTQTGVVSWSQTAASNATADSNVNFAEGMAPSQVNDSARALMASVAKWRDDISTVGTAGSGTAYTVTSNQSFASTAALNHATLTINFAVTCGASPTLNVDSLGPFPLVLDGGGTVVTAGLIRAFEIHRVTFYTATNTFVVQAGHSLMAPGHLSPYAGSSAPAGWLACDGSAVSRTTFADLFAAISTTYGSTASTTFNVPDLRARVPAGFDSGNGTSRMLGLQTGNVTGGAGTLGASGGEESHALIQSELPSYNLSPNSSAVTSNQTNIVQGSPSNSVNGGGSGKFALDATPSAATITANLPTYASGGSNAVHNTVQPTLIVNYIIKT